MTSVDEAYQHPPTGHEGYPENTGPELYLVLAPARTDRRLGGQKAYGHRSAFHRFVERLPGYIEEDGKRGRFRWGELNR